MDKLGYLTKQQYYDANTALGALRNNPRQPIAMQDTSSYPGQHQGEMSWNPTLRDYAEIGIGFTPAGVAVDIHDMGKAIKDRDMIGMGLGAVGFIPGAGDVLKKAGRNILGDISGPLARTLSKDFDGMSAMTSGMRTNKISYIDDFKKWFGKSQVVDEFGRPKVVYHGTSDATFDTFDPDRANYGLFGKGSYFTESEDIAKSYMNKGKGSNKGVYEGYARIENPIDMDATADPKIIKRFSDIIDPSEIPNIKTNEDILRKAEMYHIQNESNLYDAVEDIQSRLQEMGYDGITHIGGGRFGDGAGGKHRVHIVFDANQVKSVDNKTWGLPENLVNHSRDKDNYFLSKLFAPLGLIGGIGAYREINKDNPDRKY